MPTFRVLRQQDAFVNYEAEVEAETAGHAVDIAYLRDTAISWKKVGLAEFDASRMVALDEHGNELETERGKF